jgi:predicted HTH domain antitoxin
MNISIELPEDVAQHLDTRGGDYSRRALEALAVDAYRAGEITAAEVRRMLGHSSRWETEAFLKERQAYLDYTEDDLERDIRTLRSIMPE